MTFEEWFHKEYEPADIQIEDMIENDEVMKCSAKVYKNDLEVAFNAGLHADVHTDNSKVIEQLQKENDELRQQLCSYTKQKEHIIKLENQIEKMKQAFDSLIDNSQPRLFCDDEYSNAIANAEIIFGVSN